MNPISEVRNNVYHDSFLNNNLDASVAKLIIADPPYYQVKGDFDFIWDDLDSYLKDVELWAIECKRLLADNGTLFWYGDSKNIAYSQLILDKYFTLISNVTIHIYDRQTNKIKVEDARGFINTSERVLMYSNDGEKNNYPQRTYLRQEILKAHGKICFGDINRVLGTADNGGGVASSCLSLKKKDVFNLTEANYHKLQAWCYPHLNKPFNDFNRPFNPIEAYKMDVLRFSQEGHVTGKYKHDTVKPEKLSRYLIKSTTHENDLVIIPFAGSGTECAMSLIEGRNFIGYDIEKKYVEMANRRCNDIKARPTLLNCYTESFTPQQLTII